MQTLLLCLLVLAAIQTLVLLIILKVLVEIRENTETDDDSLSVIGFEVGEESSDYLKRDDAAR